MKRILLALLLVALTASPALAQVPQPEPLPTPQAPPPPIINVTPQVNVELPPDESPECSWRKPSTWWGCLSGAAKKSVAQTRERNIQEFVNKMTGFLMTPNPFNNERVREFWLWISGPIALALVTILAGWGAAKGALARSEITMPEWGARIVIAVAAGVATILVIPWLVGLSNEAARGMSFVPIDASLLHHGGSSGTGAGQIGIVDAFALLILAPVVFLMLLLGFLRWVIFAIWCIIGPLAAALYTSPSTEDYSLTYVKGMGAMLLCPVVEAFLLSVMFWVVITGHDIFPVSWGAWLDGLLIIILILFLLVVEAWTMLQVFGIRNYSGLKRAMRRGQYHSTTIITNHIGDKAVRDAEAWSTAARGRLGL